jgi:hypothetical protein
VALAPERSAACRAILTSVLQSCLAFAEAHA